MNSKSTLAKLLATENITVQYGNYKTAWFDIKNRVLALPLWKDLSTDVTDLLIGHEVGHALETPYEGWHDSPEKLEGCPRTYINVVEDARIERKIKDKYPGLVRSFQKGYARLFEEGMFGSQDLDWDEVKLIDKINLKAKVGAHLDVPLNDEEYDLYSQTMSTDTFADVLDVVRKILSYTQENQEELLTPPAPSQGQQEKGNDNEDNDPMGGHDDSFQPEGNQDSDMAQQSESDNSAQGEGGSDDSENAEAEEGDATSSSESSEGNETDANEATAEQGEAEADTSITDENFRRSEHKLLDMNEDGTQTFVGNEMSKENRELAFIPYERLAADRKRTIESNNYAYEGWEDGNTRVKPFEEYRDEFKTYMKEVKRNVNFAVKEFEMRKAAYRYTRAQTARTGSIDVNKLWSYKTDDDIFSRVTQLADAKNHGMFMLIDYSGSMAQTMPHVLGQLIHCVAFCKAVNIPFDVYAFTTTNTQLCDTRDEDGNRVSRSRVGELAHSNLALPQLVSSALSKSDYEEAMYHMFVRMTYAGDYWSYNERNIISKFEDYGSTPLNEALIVSTHKIKEFKRKHNIDKMNLITISDGDANTFHVMQDHDQKDNTVDTGRWYNNKIIMTVDGKKLELGSAGRKGTSDLLKNLEKRYGVKTLGFFIADGSHQWRGKLEHVYYEKNPEAYYLDDDFKKAVQKEYTKNKCVQFSDTLGYNEFFLVKGGKALNTDADEFTPAENATKGQLSQQFRKFSKSKKNNKTLLTNFGKAVA